MCIRDRIVEYPIKIKGAFIKTTKSAKEILVTSATISDIPCLLYTSDAADERSSVDLGGRRIIKKKNNMKDSSESEDERER